MKIARALLVLSLAIPSVVLMGIAVHYHIKQENGQEIVLPIQGYDPRDLLSGHYVTYKVDYPAAIPCQKSKEHEVWYVCVDTKTASQVRPKGCGRMIKGRCASGQFIAGIERFYIPETKASLLDKKTRSGAASLVVVVDDEGRALAKDLLIDGVSWKKSK